MSCSIIAAGCTGNNNNIHNKTVFVSQTSAVEYDVPPERGLGGSDGRRQRFDRGSRRFRHGPPAAPLRRLQAASRGRRHRLAPGTGQRARRRQRSAAVVRWSREAQVDLRGRELAAAVTVRRALVGDRHPPKAQELCRIFLRVEQERRKGTNRAVNPPYLT